MPAGLVRVHGKTGLCQADTLPPQACLRRGTRQRTQPALEQSGLLGSAVGTNP